MPPAKPVTEAERIAVRELHAQGVSRNEMCKRLGRGGRTISRIAAELGLSFDRSGSLAVATEVKKADAAARRARLQVDMLEAAEKLLVQMFAPAKVYNFGGKDNVYEERAHDEPPFRDKRDIASALTALVGSSTRLAEFDRGAGDTEQQSALVDLMGTLKRAWKEADHTPPPPAEPDEDDE